MRWIEGHPWIVMAIGAVLIALIGWWWYAGQTDEELPVVVATTAPTEAPTPTPTPTPTATPTATPTPTPTPTPTEDPRLAELRESSLWLGLAEWDRAGRGRELFQWTRPNAVIAEFSNQLELWDSFAPQLREEMLRLVIDEGVTEDGTRFTGLPIEDDYTSGILRWWTNGPTGTSGRGLMFVAEASYVTSRGESRLRAWPVLVDAGVDPMTSTAGRHLSTGPAFDRAVSELPETYEGVDDEFNAFWDEWLLSQPVVNPPVNPPCPEPGCLELS